MTLRDLHETATPAPWKALPVSCCVVGADGTFVARDCGKHRMVKHDRVDAAGATWIGQHAISDDAALIVALRNAYADGTLIERSKVDALIAAAREVTDWGNPSLDVQRYERQYHADLNSLRAALEALEAPNA